MVKREYTSYYKSDLFTIPDYNLRVQLAKVCSENLECFLVRDDSNGDNRESWIRWGNKYNEATIIADQVLTKD